LIPPALNIGVHLQASDLEDIPDNCFVMVWTNTASFDIGFGSHGLLSLLNFAVHLYKAGNEPENLHAPEKYFHQDGHGPCGESPKDVLICLRRRGNTPAALRWFGYLTRLP
jgi:hypothetical protein